ncbi:hypothetical protein D7S65_07075 [Ralstonia insidiosa]|nr:hypothetical protein [Ralstonia insidiosa]MBA9912157.1 hypothetical protein [Ralstonia insidiosa]MBA9936468.1 hypothetical protein [Ralstonia insidiosa]
MDANTLSPAPAGTIPAWRSFRLCIILPGDPGAGSLEDNNRKALEIERNEKNTFHGVSIWRRAHVPRSAASLRPAP